MLLRLLLLALLIALFLPEPRPWLSNAGGWGGGGGGGVVQQDPKQRHSDFSDWGPSADQNSGLGDSPNRGTLNC